MFHQWFLFLIMSEICHIGPYSNSRPVLAWIMTWYILFILGLLYGLLHTCLYNNKYCPFSRKLRFLLISASFPRRLSLCWGILSERCQGLPQHGQPCPLGMGCSRIPAPPRSAGGWSAFAFLCVLRSSALIKHSLNSPAHYPSSVGRKTAIN